MGASLGQEHGSRDADRELPTFFASPVQLTLSDQGVDRSVIEQENAVASPATPPSSTSDTTAFPAGKPRFRVTPYGSLWANMLMSSSRSNPGAFTLWVFSEELQGESTFEMDARRSRLGFDVDGPPLNWLDEEFQTHGRFEIDFLGQFITENAAGVRVRQAFWEASNAHWRVLFGQTNDIISPLSPRTLNFSVGWNGGNIGFRRAQFRIERLVPVDSQSSLVVQASINQDIVADFSGNVSVTRESTRYPVVMTRVGFQAPWLPWVDRAASLGVSGHFGETGFDFVDVGPPPLNLPPQDDARFATWSVNVDSEIPLTPGLNLRGEFFHGANLNPFLGGIGQGVCPCVRRSIHSTGGWVELARIWSKQWETHVGLGIDDPANGDFIVGRSSNQFAFANQIWHVSEELAVGCELAWWRTQYIDTRVGQIPDSQLGPRTPGEALVAEWMMRYDF